jgi:alkanesulfonate monooxygenase SsuD/methylene tetrahydromethanopterin reductase-like flavin-dependent oxidoreductase (luciferase family)
MAEEARLAEEMGFDFYALSERHFSPTAASAPETLLPFIASRTSRIKLRWASVVLLAFNHPIRVAERLTTLDVISEGRAQLGTSRSDDARTLAAFGIDPSKTRRQWDESLDVIRTVLNEQPFEFHGEIWDIPSTYLEPQPFQQPHPPLFASAVSADMHADAGRKGVGVITSENLTGGWNYMEEAVTTYRRALAEHEPVKGAVTGSAGAMAMVAHCADTPEDARAESREAVSRLLGQQHDVDAMIDGAPCLAIGSPDLFVERAKKLEAIGYDEFILRIDGMGHERHMRAIELIGKYVIPALQPKPAGMSP